MKIKELNIFIALKEKLILNAGYWLGMTIVNAGGGFLFWAVATRLYEAEQVGVASSVLSVGLLLSGFASLGLGIGFVRFLPAFPNKKEMINTIMVFVFGLTLVICGVYIGGLLFINSSRLAYIFLDKAYAFWFLVFSAFGSITNFILMVYLAYRTAEYAFWQTIISNGARLFSVFILRRFGDIGIVGSYAISLVIVFVIAVFVFLPRVEAGYRFKLSFDMKNLFGILPYSFGNFIADFLQRSPVMAIPPMILELLGPVASAQTFVAWMFGSILMSPGLSFGSSLLAESANLPESQFNKSLLKAARYAVLLTSLLGLVLFLGADKILSIFGEDYQGDVALLLRWLAGVSPLAAVNLIYFAGMRVKKQTLKLVFLSILSAAMIFLISWFFVGSKGLVATGWGWLSAQVVVIIFAMRFYINNWKESELSTQ